jgi:hypothetical protein
MTIKKRLAVTLGAVAITVAGGGVALACHNVASANGGDARPGWGHGDKNHVHTGPPGQSVNVGHGHHDADDHGKGHDKDKGKH